MGHLLFLIFSFVRDNIKTDLNQLNDNQNETSIQNALTESVAFNPHDFNGILGTFLGSL